MAKANNVTQELHKLGELTREENDELKEFLHQLNDNPEFNPAQVSQALDDMNKIGALNNQFRDLVQKIKEGDYIEAFNTLENIEDNRERLAQDAFQRLRKAGVHTEKEVELEKIEKNLEKLDQELIGDIQQLAIGNAEQELESRPTIIVEERPLKRFLNHVEKGQIKGGEEAGAIFHYQETSSGILLDKFVPLENNLENEHADRSEGFHPGDEVERIIQETGSRQNLLFAHSHPADAPFLSQQELKSHSDQDSVYQGITLDIQLGLLAAPDKKENMIWIVPQLYFKETNSWQNLKLGVAKNGNPLSEEQLKKQYPQVVKYNQSIVWALALKGGRRSETDWYNFYAKNRSRFDF